MKATGAFPSSPDPAAPSAALSSAPQPPVPSPPKASSTAPRRPQLPQFRPMRKKQLSQEDAAPTASEQSGRKRARAEREEEQDQMAPVISSPMATHSAPTSSPTTPITLLSTTHDEDEGEDEDYEFDEDGDEDEDYIVLDTDGDAASGASAEGRRTFRSKAWREYMPIKVDGVVSKGECKHCNSQINAKRGAGTSALRNHLKRCKIRKEALRVVGQLKANVMSPDGVRLGQWSFDPEVSRRELVHMIVLHELPFSIVEYDGFRKFVARLNPAFKMMSRRTLKNDCLKVFEEHKHALKEVLKSSESRVSLTMDMWTSNQTMGYMCITCHYIDAAWKIQKRIIKFSVLETPHSGISMFNAVIKCIQEWNCEDKLFAITLDNASNNGKMAKLLKLNLSGRHMLVGGGKLLHQRRAAHVLNLVCQAGLTFLTLIIANIQESVKFIRGSEARKERFEKIVAQEDISCGKRPSLDVPTRWNSTFLMIDTAIHFRRAFNSLGMQDPQYIYAPTFDDWERSEVVLRLLKVFYEATNVISGSKYPTANLYFHEIWKVKVLLEKEASEVDLDILQMVRYMQKKLKKYWKLSWKTLALPVILVPRFKLSFLEFRFQQAFGTDVASRVANLKETFQALFNEHAQLNNLEYTQGVDVDMGINDEDPLADWDRHRSLNASSTSVVSSELETYIAKPPLPRSDQFDNLSWWSMNSLEYPILARMARDVLAVPASTVASESTFSTGKRVISDFRSQLTPETAEALICLQDWLRESGSHQLSTESIYDILGQDELPI